MNVIKRNNKKEPFDYEKINKVLIWATDGIDNVSASDIAMNAKLHLYDKITTKEIHGVMIESAVNMINEETPNYQYVSARLLNFLLRKEVFNSYDVFPTLKELVTTNVKLGVYDKDLLTSFTDEEFNKIETFIKHNRDEKFSYAGLKQMMDKYLVKDRKDNIHYETPQFAYISIACMLYSNYDKADRLDKIKSYYDDISTHSISLPTPIVAGVRTPNKQYSSCTLIDCGDTLDSIFNSNTAIGKYISKRAGIGLNLRIRGVNSKVRDGEVVHTGIIPFLKMFEKTVKSCSQGGIRGGAATFHYPFWHIEIKDILVLKNNRGVEDARVRRTDHSIQFSKLFYQRFIENKNISLFSPSDVPGLYEAFGYNDQFDVLYEKYENDNSIRKETIKARDLMDVFTQERIETGRLYLQNIDQVNSQSPFKEKIYMSNLCVAPESEILTDKGYVKIGDHENEMINVWNGKEYTEVKVLKTGVNQKLIKINFSNGESIECTEYHKFYININDVELEVRANELKVNDNIITFFDPFNGQYIDDIFVDSIEDNSRFDDTFCVNEPKEHKIVINGVLTGNCQEINLITSPIEHLEDGKIVEKVIQVLNKEEFDNFKKENELLSFYDKKTDLFNLNTEYGKILSDKELLSIEDKSNLQLEKVELVYGNKPAEIALCVLGGINLGKIKNFDKLEGLCENLVRGLDYIIEMQDYPMEAAKKMLKRRSIGVGVTNFAYWLAKNNLTYDDPKTLIEVDRLFEHIQYYLIKASVKLAKEYGPCEYYKKTKWSDGILPIDRYNKNVDQLVKRELECDWEALRADLLLYGIRNSTLSAIMPVESSSLISNSTNGIEPIRELISFKNDKSAKKPFVVPEMSKLKNKYQLAWSFSNSAMNNIVSVIQKWVDQGISVNHYYDKRKYTDNNLPLSEVAKDILQFYKFGGKQLYYANSVKDKTDNFDNMEEESIKKEDDSDDKCADGVCML